tara:strand:+ start:11927 stop:12865 length:939 start_codon:yes stop_codon:yes gene_type:complete
MKNKIYNKINNNFIKLITILVLLAITLYFSFSDLSYKENFNSNYTNLCKNKPTKFYSSINPNASIEISEADYGTFPPNTNSCEYKCNNTKSPNECNLYIYNGPDSTDSSCNLYSLVSGKTIYVNCDDKEIKNEFKGTYLGEGLVKTSYYNEHISDFSYHNFLLDQAINIKNNYNNFDVNNDWKNNADFLDNNIYPYLDKILNHNDISKNELYTYLNYDSDLSLNIGGKDMNKIDINNEFLKLNKNNNKAQKINNNFDFTKNSFIYTILAILLIISIILVVLYKLFPNYLNEFTLLIYFISIILIVFFIHILI